MKRHDRACICRQCEDTPGAGVGPEPTSERYESVRRDAAIALVKRQRDKAVDGGGTWQTWDWLLKKLQSDTA